MLLFLICVVVSIIGNLWVVAKIWPVSKVYSFIAFIFFPAAIFFMFTHWGDEEHDIKVPFMLTLIAGIASVYLLDKLEAEYGDEDEEEESWLYDGRYDVAMNGGDLWALTQGRGRCGPGRVLGKSMTTAL